MYATPSDLRVLTLTKIDRCAWNEHEIDDDGRCVPCNACTCDDGRRDCALHGDGRRPAPAVCVCTSNEFARPACAVHGKAV